MMRAYEIDRQEASHQLDIRAVTEERMRWAILHPQTAEASAWLWRSETARLRATLQTRARAITPYRGLV